MVAGLLVGSTGVQARLGESMGQCRARYGKVTIEGTNHMTCNNGSVQTSIHFKDGRADSIRFQFPKDSDVTDDVLAGIIKANPGALVKQFNNRVQVSPKPVEKTVVAPKF